MTGETLCWAGNLQLQPTGYARIAREIMPRLQAAGYDVVQYAVSGLNNTMPTEINGITTYGPSSMGGNLGINDYPVVDQLEDADFWLVNFDAWAVSEAFAQYDFRYVLYPPIDHDPVAPNWMPALQNAFEIVPYTRFGERVISESIPEQTDKVHAPIYHGVDTDAFYNTGVSKSEFFGVPEDTFVIGIFKNNQGTRWKPVRQLRAIKLFIDEYDLWDDVSIYLHSSIQGEGAFNLDVMINRLELGPVVQLVNQGAYRWGVHDRELRNAYSACDVVLNCTAGEGFGLPILEAFATETPVIASAYSSMPELLGFPEGEIMWDDDRRCIGTKDTGERCTQLVGDETYCRYHIADAPEGFEPTRGPPLDAPRGWLVPVYDSEPTLGKHSWRRTNRAEHIAVTLAAAYEHPEQRRARGEHAREWVEDYSWDAVGEQWVEYVDGLVDRTFEADEDLGIDWAKVEQEKGGVGGFQ